jgi:hypothetical protein
LWQSAIRAELYNLLYAPILYYQDLPNEIERENFGEAFGKKPEEVRKKLPKDEDILFLIETSRRLAKEILGSDKLPASRRDQLKCLRDVYRSQIPEAIYNAYDTSL